MFEMVLRLGAGRVVVFVKEDLGGTEIEDALLREPSRGPFPCRREGLDVLRAPSGWRIVGNDGFQSVVGVRIGGRHGSESGLGVLLAVALEDLHPASPISPVVIVPVLSKQRTSTRASSSTLASSFASACLRASAITPERKAIEMSNTRPSGTIATAAATVPTRASCQLSSASSRERNSSPAAGGMMKTSHLRIRLTPLRNSDSASLNCLASSPSELA